MFLDQYFTAVEEMLSRIRSTQREAITQAAQIIADSMAAKGILAVMDTGHMLKYEALNRAGGFVSISPFSYTLSVESQADHRTTVSTPEESAELEARTVALALDSSRLQKGDVLLINSNSGRTANVIEVALQCRARGIATIGLASRAQMNQCAAAHPSGRKLFDVCDVNIDNCGPHGDALVEVPGNERMCPGSGLGATYVFWAIHAEVVERLQAVGIAPTIYRSVHVGGPEHVEAQRRKFRETGY